MTLKDAYIQGKKELKKAGLQEADLDAWYLLEYVTGISRAAYYADPRKELTSAWQEKYRTCLEKRKKRIPLQHITGVQEFMGLSFSVNEHVLIPRQDTEILVEEALKFIGQGTLPCEGGKMRVLDLCTGSGCILLSVLHHAGGGAAAGRVGRCGAAPGSVERCGTVPGSAAPGSVGGCGTAPGSPAESGMGDIIIEGTGADISGDALDVAVENAEKLGIGAEFIQGDLFENISGRFAMILSNPPYIKTKEIDSLQEEVRLHDPRAALDGKEDGLYFYRRIVSESRDYLLPQGRLVFEIGYDQAEDVKNMMSAAGYADITVKKDLAGLDRVVCGRYIR